MRCTLDTNKPKNDTSHFCIILNLFLTTVFITMSSSSNRRKGNIFMENKNIWNRVFFSNTYENFKWPRAEVDQFWLFMQKYSSNSQNKSADTYKRRKHLGEKLLKKYSTSLPDEWSDIDTLKSKVKELNSQHFIDSSAIREFRDILLMFVDFNQGRKLKKSEKLKSFQENLPIYQHRDQILEAIQSYSVILIAGDTGCGKSTQVPQYLLKANYENICCTQPRRLACIALRNRLSFETVDEYGAEIGYQIRFEKHKTKHTKMLFLTEGLLLRQMIEDPLLCSYNVIILDEIHERHLSCDFLLGAIKCLLNRRRDNLKVILMSATVNCDLFSSYFGNCPVVKVPGRLFPIKVEYFPVEKFALLKTTSKISPEPYLKLLKHIDTGCPESERGDVLIFLSGFQEIENVGETLKSYAEQTGKWIILYLHSRLSVSEQDKVFDIAPPGVRKCILSTNIAETSLTIDGIRFVLDSGKVKELYYDSKIRMQKLQEIWVSKASAEQRKGRAGRTGPGVCYRLYSPKDYEAMADYSMPEIRRVSLESLLLNMVSMGLKDVRTFPFLEPPEAASIESTVRTLIGYETLEEGSEQITLLGRILSRLPVDIAIGKMLIIAIGHQLVQFFLSAAACLSVQNLFSIRSLNDLEAVEERRRISSTEGDLFSALNFYSRWLMLRSQAQNTRSWCRRLGLEEQRFYEVTKLRNQFREIVTDSGLLAKNSGGANSEQKLSRSERILKHGERKLYAQLKRDYEQHKHKRRKVLNVNEKQNEDDDGQQEERPGGGGDAETTMKDVEFKLIFDSAQLAEIEQSHRLSYRELQVAKLIVALSFYPQLAIADADNSYRPDGDQMFHTKDRPFVVLHPSSVYASQPELLRPASGSEVEYSPLGALSTRQTLVGYISFIETSKTYICNCYPVSAIHALLLCAHDIDTNEDMSRIVCDNWIELHCASWEESQEVLLKALQLRHAWSRLLESLFSDLGENANASDELNEQESLPSSDEEEAKKKEKALNCEEEANALKQQMSRYLDVQPKYAMRRLLPADLKHLHSGQPLEEEGLAPFENYRPLKWLRGESVTVKPNSTKGGIRIGKQLNFNCLKVNQTDEMVRASRKAYECTICKAEMHLSVIEWARHQEICAKKAQQHEEKLLLAASTSKSSSADRSKDLYHCPECDREFASFTSIDILRHRRQHASQRHQQ